MDRVLRIRSDTIHEVTLSNMKEHEIRVFVQSHTSAINALHLKDKKSVNPFIKLPVTVLLIILPVKHVTTPLWNETQ